MSNRTIIEINHDYAAKIDTERFEVMTAIRDLLRNPGDANAVGLLKRYGITRLAVAHHSDDRAVYINGRAAE